jgi:tetratricopeptide (TPR) repeat protein/predicted Ser/Thr protein kinase
MRHPRRAVDQEPTVERTGVHDQRDDTTRLGDDTEPQAPSRDAPRLPRGTSIDRYVVIDELGAGGMGVVYAAYDPELDRRVAIKLLRPSLLGEGRPRLVREAQAIARIAHPNVVAVYDVGELDGSVFVAMEFVEGQTLNRWLRAKPRTIPEIVGVFRQAGRGLAAAHAADLVHRDFKPDNVLVGLDGRVRVVDFGLARGRGSVDSVGVVAGLSFSNLDEALTEAGTVMGTPAYMSPEQLAGRLATAASDQFAFCVALYEALYGERPFDGKSVESLTRAVIACAIREPAAGRSVPAWLRRAVVQGLQTAPKARHPSMEVLLRALAANPTRHRRRWLATSAAGLGALAVAVLAYRSGASRERSPCTAAADELGAVWNDDRRTAVAAAFHATGLPHADDTWERVSQRIDDYAHGWSGQATAACEATHVEGTQSAELLERRRRCMGERLQRLDAFLEVIAEPDAAIVDRAVLGVRALPDLGGCLDVDALEAGVAPPEQEDTRLEVAQLRDALARAEALYSAAKYREQLEQLEPLLERARHTGYLPIIAQVEHALAQTQRSLDLPDGMPMLRAAFRDALAAGDDRRAAMIAVDMGYELGYEQRLDDAGREWLDIAQALGHRVGGVPRLEIGVTNTLAAIAIRRASYDEAQALFEKVVELQRELDPDDPNVAVALQNLGSAYAERRDFEHAREYLQQSAEHTERVLGPKHPSMTSLYANLALLSVLQGRFEEAEPALERTLELQRAVLGEDHIETARSLVSMAVVQRNLGRPEAAEKLHRQALAVRLAKLGPEHPEVAESMRNLALTVADLGRPAEAVALAREAQETAGRRLGPEHPEHGTHAAMVATLLVEAGEPRQALQEAERAIEILDARGPGGPLSSLEARRVKGRAQRELGRHQAAIFGLEQAIVTAQTDAAATNELAMLRFELAQSLRAAGRDPERTMQLAEQARDALREAAPARRRELERVEAWLAEPPPP